MNAIVAVYSDWGIGANGTQPVVVRADRARFASLTRGATVIVGRKTLEDFPGGKPLKNRENIVISCRAREIEGARVAHDIDEAVLAASGSENVFVLGGASVFEQLIPHIDRVYVTKIDACPESDSFFPNLDKSPEWTLAESEPWQDEDGLRYCFCTYIRK